MTLACLELEPQSSECCLVILQTFTCVVPSRIGFSLIKQKTQDYKSPLISFLHHGIATFQSYKSICGFITCTVEELQVKDWDCFSHYSILSDCESCSTQQLGLLHLITPCSVDIFGRPALFLKGKGGAVDLVWGTGRSGGRRGCSWAVFHARRIKKKKLNEWIFC